MALIRDASTGKALDKNPYEEKRKEEKRKEKELLEQGFDPKVPYKPRAVKRIPVKLNDDELKHLNEIYGEVAVLDFGDMYHLTDEERKEKNDMYDLFKTIRNVKTKYKRLDEYVINYRKILHVVKEIAKTNGIYSPEKFLKKVLEGEIILYGIQFPKYNVSRKKRREVNWSVVTEYIMNDKLDPKDLLIERRGGIDEYDVVENPAQMMKTYFGKSYEEFVNGVETGNHYVDTDDLESYRGENIAVPIPLREISEDFKYDKGAAMTIRDAVLEMRRASKYSNPYDSDYSGSVFDQIDSDIQYIQEMDEERNYFKKKKKDVPEFHGSLLTSKDVDKYSYDVDEYVNSHTKVNIEGSVMTIQEYNEEELRRELEENGWNIRKFYGIGDDEKRMKRNVARENKRLKKIKDRMIEASKRREKKVKTVGFSVKKVDKDGNKVNGKKKKKSKVSKKGKKDLKSTAFNFDAEDFDAYAKSMGMDTYDF